MAGCFSLRIANVTIGLICEDPQMRLDATGPANAFLVDEAKPDLSVSAAWGDLPEAICGEKVFDSGGPWQLYRENGSYVFRFASPATGPRPYKIASFNKDFTVGHVRLHRAFFPSDVPVYPLEYPLDELLITNWLARGRGVEIHACGLVDGAGNGHLFVGQSGAGKSTMARLWRQRNGATILGDDRVVLRGGAKAIRIYGTPWHREAGFADPGSAPLAQVCFLRHGQKDELAPLEPMEALGRFFACSFPPFYSPESLDFLVGFLENVVKTVPCYELRFVPDESAVALIEGTV